MNADIDKTKLVEALKTKRDAEGLSLRKLSAVIGVSFSSLARIERGEGEPDNNSTLRILDWLGKDGRDAGLTYDNVALVHFRASKNSSSKTIQCLLNAADRIKRSYDQIAGDVEKPSEDALAEDEQHQALALSKPEMEEMAVQLRSDLGVANEEPLNALAISIEGVDIAVPGDIEGLSKNCKNQLVVDGSAEWSAMSVPLNSDFSRWVVLRNDAHTIERQRVTYLEECWHILLGHKLTKIARIANGYGRTYESTEEHDAYYLAAATLLPENAMRKCIAERLSADKIASGFGTSRELAEYRIKRLGLWREYKGLQVTLGHASRTEPS